MGRSAAPVVEVEQGRLVGKWGARGEVAVFRGVRYVPVSIPRQGGGRGADVSRISLEGADPCGPSFEQLQAQVRTEVDFSKLKLEMHSNLVRVRKFAFLYNKLEVRS